MKILISLFTLISSIPPSTLPSTLNWTIQRWGSKWKCSPVFFELQQKKWVSLWYLEYGIVCKTWEAYWDNYLTIQRKQVFSERSQTRKRLNLNFQQFWAIWAPEWCLLKPSSMLIKIQQLAGVVGNTNL